MIRHLLLCGILTFTAMGCASTGRASMTGILFGNFKEAGLATSSAGNSKEGRACSKNVLGKASGDSSIDTAKKNGNISTVSTVDYEIYNFIGFYGKLCTIVRGE